jgi:hypothetical protein
MIAVIQAGTKLPTFVKPKYSILCLDECQSEPSRKPSETDP